MWYRTAAQLWSTGRHTRQSGTCLSTALPCTEKSHPCLASAQSGRAADLAALQCHFEHVLLYITQGTVVLLHSDNINPQHRVCRYRESYDCQQSAKCTACNASHACSQGWMNLKAEHAGYVLLGCRGPIQLWLAQQQHVGKRCAKVSAIQLARNKYNTQETTCKAV